MQSIAKDEVIPALNVFSRVTRYEEPLYGLLLTTGIAFVFILIGALDHVAPIVDYFFLMCYAFVNLACALMSLLGAPNWRPRFRVYHWSLSLLGFFLCLFIMISTHWYYAVGAFFICALIYIYVAWKGNTIEWGDGIKGLYLTLSQFFLLRLEDREMHPKNWRPQLLILTKANSEVQRKKMLEIAHQLKAGKGLTIMASIMIADALKEADRENGRSKKEQYHAEMKEAEVVGFVKIAFCPEQKHMATTLSTLIQSVGVGSLKPNTLMVGWPTGWRYKDEVFCRFLDKVHRGAALDMCLLIPKGIVDWPDKDERLIGTIDIWWILNDGGLLLLIGFLLRKSPVWESCNLRLFIVSELGEDNSDMIKREMTNWLYMLRIDGTVEVVELERVDVTAYTVERPVAEKERQEALSHLEEKLISKLEPQVITNKHRGGSCRSDSSSRQSRPDALSEKSSITSMKSENEASSASQYTFTERQLLRSVGEGDSLDDHLDQQRGSVRLHSATRLNKTIVAHSSESKLVVINLPQPPKTRAGMSNYMSYMDILTGSVKRVLLVRGTGKEVITIYS